MSFIRDMAIGSVNMLVGMGITLRNFFRKPVTLQYPEERRELPAGYRGMPSLLVDPGTGSFKCTGCGVCARNCPIRIISVTGKPGSDGKKTVDQYSIDMSRCMICGLCVESCPFGAMAMHPHFELAVGDKADLLYDLERLAWPNLDIEATAADRRLVGNGFERPRILGPGVLRSGIRR